MQIPNTNLDSLIRNYFYKEPLSRKIYRGIVIDVDRDGTRFPQKVKGSVKCRIPSLHSYISSNDDLPVFLPFFWFGGKTLSIPNIYDILLLTFEYIEPVSQGYWLTTDVSKPLVFTKQIPLSQQFSKLTKFDSKYYPIMCVYSMFPNTSRNNIDSNLPYIVRSLKKYGLFDKVMTLVALATIRAETEDFVPISEFKSNLNTSKNSTVLFDKYEPGSDGGGRLGNTKVGDGARYKGRGFVQLTGRENYETIGNNIGQNLIDNPELANDPQIASDILASFLKSRESNIRQAIDAQDFRTARTYVNGGTNGLDRFIDAYSIGDNCYTQNGNKLDELPS